jgi:LysR family transcriptional regulator for metE and metH
MRPRLDIHHLQMIVAIERAGSAADAATHLGVTPSALSHRIREAERRLDTALFTRLGRNLRLTPAGEMLHEVAKRLIDDLEQVELLIEKMGEGVRYVVRFGIGAYNSYRWLPEFLAWFREKRPDVQVDIVANAAFEPMTAVAEKRMDVAMMSRMPLVPGLKAIPLFDDELLAIFAPGHRLSHHDFVEAEDLAQEDMLTYSFHTLPGHDVDLFWRPGNVSPRRLSRVEHIEAIVELVKAGFGSAILTRWAMEPHLTNGSLAGARLTEQGVSLGWDAVLRENEEEGSPSHDFATALAAWWSDKRDRHQPH